MAHQEHLDTLLRGVATWNDWKKHHPAIGLYPHLSDATLAKPTSSVPGPGTRSWSAPSLTASAALDETPCICYHFDRCRTIGTVDGRRHPDARTR